MEPFILWEILVPCSMPKLDSIGNETGQIVPVKLPHHKVWDEYVGGITGGLSIMKPLVNGQWVYDNVVYKERMIPVRVSCSREKLVTILKFTRKHYRQIAVCAYKISDDFIVYSGEEDV